MQMQPTVIIQRKFHSLFHELLMQINSEFNSEIIACAIFRSVKKM